MPDRLRRWIENAARGSFARTVAILTAGTLVDQGITVLILPILTRLYAPEAFGVLAVYSSILMTFAVVACLRLDITVSLPSDNGAAINAAVLAMLACTGLAALAALVVLVAGSTVAHSMAQPAIATHLWMIPIALWFAGLYSTLVYWSLRNKRADVIARAQLSRAIGGGSVQIGFGLAQVSPFGLLFGHVIYLCLGCVGMARSVWRNDRAAFGSVNRASIARAWRANWRFPVYSVPEALLDSALVFLPLLIITSYEGVRESGFLLIAQTLSGVPVSLISTNVSRLYLAESAARRDAGDLGRFTLSLLKNMALLGVVPFAILFFIAPFGFALVFGENWRRAGEMVSWLTLATFVQFFVIPIASIMHVLNKLLAMFMLKLIGFIIVMGAPLGVGMLKGSGVFEAYAIALTIFYVIYFAVVLHYAMKKEAMQCVE